MATITKIVILKAIGLALLFIVTVVGCNAHFNSSGRDFMAIYTNTGVCDLVKQCPGNAMPLERTFVAFTIICLILSALSLALGFIMDMNKTIRMADGGYYILAGLMLFIAGCVILAATVRVDNFVEDCILNPTPMSCTSTVPLTSAFKATTIKGQFRKLLKYADKIAAGVLAFLNAILYFGTGAMILISSDK